MKRPLNFLPDKIKKKAYELFAKREPMERIARTLHLSKDTLYKWRKKYGWDERRDKIEKEAIRRTDEALTEYDEKVARVGEAVLARFAQSLGDPKTKIAALEALNWTKLVREVKGAIPPPSNLNVQVDVADIINEEIKKRDNLKMAGKSGSNNKGSFQERKQ